MYVALFSCVDRKTRKTQVINFIRWNTKYISGFYLQIVFCELNRNIYIANFDPKIIEELAKKQIKLKRRILILDNDLYHGYTYNEENTVVFVNGKSPLYYFPDYKIDVKVVRTDVNKLKNYDSKYKIGDFFY